MRIKDLVDLLQKFPPDFDVIYDSAMQLKNDRCHVEYSIGDVESYNMDLDGQIEDFYIDPDSSLKLVCLTAREKPHQKAEGGKTE